LRIWDIDDGRTVKSLVGHSDVVEAVAAIDKRRIVSASADGTLRIWDTETGTTLRVITGHEDWVLGVAALDRRRVASVSADGNTCVWEAQSGDRLANFGLDVEATAIAVAADHETLVVGDAEGRVHFLYFQRP
jgi:WD40 repeat protein